MKRILILAAVTAAVLSVFLSGCGKNPTVRTNIRKKISDDLTEGFSEFKKGKFLSCRVFFEQALKEASLIDSTGDKIFILQALGDLNLKLEDFTTASNYAFYAAGLAASEKIDAYNYEIFYTIGKYYDKTADRDSEYQTALSNYNRAMLYIRNDGQRAELYNSMGITCKKMNRLDEALKLIETARYINEFAQNFDGMGDNYYGLGEIYFLKGQYDRSLEMFFQSLSCDKQSENSSGIVEDLRYIGTIYAKLKKKAQAMGFYSRALDAAQGLGSDAMMSRIKGLMAELSDMTNQ